MKRAVSTLVVIGIALAFGFGLAGGFDVAAAIIFMLIVACGALAIAVTARSELGEVGPASCDSCGGLISPNAPYCKHCGAGVEKAS